MKANRSITSREYKLILNPKRFANRKEGAIDFWDFLFPIVQAHQGKVTLLQNSIEEERKTWYVDTKDFKLRKNYKTILRLRYEKDAKPGKQFKITLKMRAADRYYAASCPWIGKNKKTKFEEDITPQYIKYNDLATFLEECHFQFDEDNPSTFSSKFSLSTSVKQRKDPNFDSMEKARELFPLLKKIKTKKERLKTVNGFVAFEIFRKLAQVQFGSASTINFGLSFWYAKANHKDQPIVAEFSFYFDALKTTPESGNNKSSKSKLEQFDTKTIVNANCFFRALQGHTDWFVFDKVTTKTAFAYSG